VLNTKHIPPSQNQISVIVYNSFDPRIRLQSDGKSPATLKKGQRQHLIATATPETLKINNKKNH